MLVLIRGAGDLASGAALRLHRANFPVVMTDLPQPTAIRRTVCFSQAIRFGKTTVEDAVGVCCKTAREVKAALSVGEIPVLPDETASCRTWLHPEVLVAGFLWSLEDRPRVFRLTPSRFVLWTASDAQAERLVRLCEERLEQPFAAGHHAVRCPGTLVKFSLDGMGNRTEKVADFLEFCVQLADSRGWVQTIRDSRTLQEQFA